MSLKKVTELQIICDLRATSLNKFVLDCVSNGSLGITFSAFVLDIQLPHQFLSVLVQIR